LIKLGFRDVTALATIPVRIGSNIFICEYARSESERQEGLKNRRYLPANRGMLFDTYGRYRPLFHMKDVFLPLEALFISTQNKLIDIVPMVPLDASTTYTTYKNIPIKHVIELNRHYCERHGIKINDTVFIEKG